MQAVATVRLDGASDVLKARRSGRPTNTVESAWSLFDRAVIGSYHKVSKKHLPAYLQEFEFRFNNRENPFLFRDTLLRLIANENLTYKDLTSPRRESAS